MLKKIKDIVIYKDENYNTFPNAIVLKDGTVMVGFRQAPDWQVEFNNITHIDPCSKGVYVKSRDNGVTWDSKPSLIYKDFLYGVQDPCLNYLSDGTILSTFFMWKATDIDESVKNSTKPRFVIGRHYEGEMMDAHTVRSTDNGKTWSHPTKIEYEGKDGIRASVRGNVVELPDSSILLGISTYHEDISKRFVRIIKSFNKGKTWEKVFDIYHPKGHFMGEPNLFKTEKGKLVCFLRTHIEEGNKSVYEDHNNNLSPMHVCYSHDNGNTWSVPKKTKYTSPSPFHALQLKSGNVLMSYGHRYSPYGIKAVLLDGELDNIDTAQELTLRSDGVNHDLGYTSSVQMENGDILVTYYIFHENDTMRYIGGSILREE